MSWTPQAEGLKGLIELLRNSTCPDTQQLESFNNVPDYNNYLAYILSSLPELEASIRAIAGLTLKNNIRSHYTSIPPQVLDYVKDCVLRSLADPSDSIRSTAGTVLTNMVSRDLKRFPDIIPKLAELMDHSEVKLVEGAISAIEKICEDNSKLLTENEPQLLQILIPKLVHFFKHPTVRVRVSAICSVNQFVFMRAEALMTNIEAYVAGLYQLTGDDHEDVRKSVCQAFVSLLEVRVDVLLPQLQSVVEFMLFCTQHLDESVALEACEFWLTFAEQENLQNYLEPFLPKIVPVLLKGMVYSEEDIILLGGDEDDENIPDSQQDIKPRHHKAKTHDQELETKTDQQKSTEFEDEEDDFDDDDDEDDLYTEWNLRKCSAATIDVLSSLFRENLLNLILPYLKNELFHQDWEHRESGILALGAIADGCMDGMIQHLPTLIPILISQLNETKHLVRSIACWTLSRYISWIVDPNDGTDADQHRQKYLNPVIEGLLRMVLDTNKRVQEAACSAFATLEEEAGPWLAPYLNPILYTFSTAFKKYQHKNLLILYDAVGTLADSVGSSLADPALIELLMPPLTEKWATIKDDDPDLFPLLECLSSVAVALGPNFGSFAQPVWQRCLLLIQNTLHQVQLHQQNPYSIEEPDKDFMIVALDLISGMIQGLGEQCDQLLAASQPSLFQLLVFCMRDNVPEVRQSACALLGDMAINTFNALRPHLPVILPEVIAQIEPKCDHSRISVCNNAIWATGEIALQYKQEMLPFVNMILERTILLLNDPSTPHSLAENAAIAIGRLGFVCTAQVAPHLEVFIESWCKSIAVIRDNSEKESAYLGLCKMIEANPNAVLKSFAYLCDAIVAWNRLSPILNEYFRKILLAYKEMLGDQWIPYKSTFPPVIQQRLAERYGI